VQPFDRHVYHLKAGAPQGSDTSATPGSKSLCES
jgi:hypothetical protein